ncbi:filamentous hemagglutinin N-terminal domain-containing protein [Phascolarctobacterium faecium]|nr:filamentous hemagglutinin N-terminal domain-containing protein [Phascolarctobacterium faecium]MDM8108458.1 filamentous hemagglutinin N-terminal domain-containing protein [Phascolarctobacterium faecium]
MNSKKNLKRNLLICLLAGSAVMYTLPLHAATSVIGNGTLPSGGEVMAGQIDIPDWARPGGTNPAGNLEMNIIQNSHNGVIKWDSFDIGGSATVNFRGPQDFNTLNYVNSGAASQIYGTINANNNGNIFIVNPAGVQIGNSAQINVGSLYVSNSKLTDDALKAVDANNINFDFNAYMKGNGAHTDAALMSLGNINASKVTFEGDGRIVIDSERLKDVDGTEKLTADKIFINTKDENNLVIGYDGYNENKNNGSYNIASNSKYIATVNGKNFAQNKGYMWVEDVNQLQDIGESSDTLKGNYALRNSIDGTQANNFKSIGSNTAFSGKFDGIDYNIFNLNISGTDNVGLFGKTNGATINNVTLVGGSVTGTGSNVGAIVGNANNTTLTNVVNSAAVSGDSNVGGIVGIATGTTVEDAINTGAIEGIADTDNGGINVGGLIGSMNNSHLIGNSYNLGDVTSIGSNVGGLVGSASNSTIGNPSVVNDKPVENIETVYNRMNVTGAYNVGGIVGNMTKSTVQNAENSGTVLASGHNNGKYIFHTDNAVFDGNNDKLGEKDVYIANAGGIVGTSSADSTITDVLNTGDVSSSKVKEQEQEYYAAGNVGGIVGSAVDTNITNATNRENEVRGAHNVGGVAGYFGSTKGDSTDKDTPHYTVTNGINDGGDIMATGARNASGFVKEKVRSTDTGAEETIIGNMGGVVGYLDGDNVYVTGSANRGTVHSLDITGDTVSKASQASNTGGVVGKIDRSATKSLSDIKNNIKKAAVSNSYNTGDVRGYMGVGGVVGMMYNGEVAGSYNLGSINTTRRAADAASNAYPSVNMGGVVGDTTEQTTAKALIYDVYNKGQIGDETYNYYARHVGGVVGRLSGDVEKAYNTGAIYNGYNVVGGIAGWFYTGSINNSFNTGNITVINHDTTAGSQVGGIVGGVGLYSDTKGSTDSKISNAYNLGTIRSFAVKNGDGSYTTNQIGGIIGFIMGNSGHDLKVENVYTTGNLYAGRLNEGKNDNGLGSIIGVNSAGGGRVTVTNAYYIRPQDGLFTDLTGTGNATGAMDFDKKSNSGNYGGFTFSDDNGLKSGNVTDGDWRIYDGNTPILNAFLPNSEDYFSKDEENMDGISSIQYGTAYDPLLTIIKADDKYLTDNNLTELTYNWSDLGISNAAGLVVYGAGLTLDKVNTSGGSGYFGGTIYADGALNLNGGANDIGLGSAADIYGSAVNITTNGKVTIYGDVTATGNGTKEGDNPNTNGSITITAGDVDVYGTLTSASNNTQDATVTIPGIEDTVVTNWTPGDINNPYASMVDIADRFAHTTGASAVDGNITINAGTNADGENIGNGNVNLYFGNKEQGLITTGGDLTVTGTGDVYVDSDLDIGGDMTLTSTGADSEVLLTLTNIGKVQANRFNAIIENAINGIEITEKNEQILTDAILNAVNKAGTEHTFTGTEAGYIVDALLSSVNKGNSKVEALNELKEDIAVAYMHDFMHSFYKPVSGETKPGIYLNAASGDAKLTVDMWVENTNGSGQFNFEKYDTNFPGTTDNHTFKEELNNLNFAINDVTGNASESVYVEVSTGEQLKAIQNAGSKALEYNYALMGDINASDVEDYVAIGTGSGNGFTGTFDGRGNRIIGLNVDKVKGQNTANAGIFDTIGTNGVVKDVNIYSGTFTGTTTAGAVAGVNNGRIEGIVTFGNTVTVTGDNGNASNVGGIVGVNNSGGTVDDVESTGSVIAGNSNAVAGGLVGTNDGGLANSFSDSAVTVGTNVTGGTSSGLGGVVGINNGNVQYVDSLGVTNGGTTGSSNVGGVIGINKGNMYSGYNESIVSGNDYVGGIIGQNTGKYENDKWNGGTVENVVNATGVTGSSNYVGGLVGTNTGSVTNGRNNGTIAGTNYVGGLVGDNADEHSILTNLVNDSSAEILGVEYVGGIAGKNRGTITADRENNNLINRGSITGHKYVGGVAGLNVGTITNTNIDVELKVNNAVSGDHQYFGGIVGQNGDDKNEGTIENATNSNKIVAPNASYVGGIVGWNTQKGKLIGMGNSNEGEVIGGSYVGGVIGKNDAAIGSKNAAQVGIKNEGVVIATNGGAGGLIGENNAAITNTIMTNKGEVHGNNSNDGSGTGGLIGTNSGAISYSSMTNEVTGTVTGVYNVGGLIGVNKADITGGRDTVNDKDSGYYLNKIYNNGVINVGNYTDADKDGKYEFAASNGQNIGGLFGTNSGKVEAAYNTGAINASGSTNVGGIAGVNEQGGKLDQVFNTVMTGVDDKGNNVYGTITGGTNVGGLIGNNTGTLSNAYNTTEVSGNAASTGNLVGTNSGTVQYVYGYGVDSIDELIGEVTGTGSISHGHAIGAAENSWFQQDVYEDFTFGANGWKIYDGSTLPMLSVFLTKVTVVDQHLVNQYFSAKHYGELHQITADDIKALIAIGAISAPDGFGAFNNNNGLIQGVADDAMANSGNWLYSQQILGSNINGLFNPNNLGYDISLVYSPFENEDWPNNHWNYLFNDAPFDRNKDFRERKAEVNFVDGGMEI